MKTLDLCRPGVGRGQRKWTWSRAGLVAALVSLGAPLAACMGLAEFAYDEVARHERAQCERLVAMADRQACIQRIQTATQQATEQRRKP